MKGLQSLLAKRVMVHMISESQGKPHSYVYSGTVTGVDGTVVYLENVSGNNHMGHPLTSTQVVNTASLFFVNFEL